MNHKFGEVRHTNAYDDHPYVKCEICGKVMFLSGDDFFNMECQAASEQRESLRNKLEVDNG